MRRHRGFSLIELAIVLAVITLIAGALLLAKDSVVARAQTADLISTIKDLAQASKDFKARYSYYPGDLPNAGNYVTANGGISAGCSVPAGGSQGNGLVDTEAESACGLQELVKAGLLSKIQFDQSSGNYVIRSMIGQGTQVSLWRDSNTNTNAVRVTQLPCTVALELDSKLDNDSDGGTPLSQGSVIGQDGSGGTIANCVSGGTNDPVAILLVRY